MPTTLPSRARRTRPLVFFVFVVALAAASVAIEILDPAPMDVAAALVASP